MDHNPNPNNQNNQNNPNNPTKESTENPMMNFFVSQYTLRNMINENQKRKICVEADALASPTGKADPPFLQLPRVMSTVIASQNHQLATGGLKTIQEGGEGGEGGGGEEMTGPADVYLRQRSINCPRCGQDLNWCECSMPI